MKLLFTVFALFYVNSVSSQSRTFFRGHSVGYDIPPPQGRAARADVTTEYISQRLDHFDPSNTNLWTQRYYVNTEFYNTTDHNAIFLMIAGEGEASTGWMTGGAWADAAEKYSALLLQLEHRFYGNSHPFEDLRTENLRYLSSRQALEDIANFITAMNQIYNANNDAKWIVFGGSYAGSLASWLRQKYPHLVQGAMAASGPLFAQLDFPEYLDVVAADLATHSQACVDTVKEAFNQLQTLIATPGEVNITELFNLCDDVTEVNSDSDIATLLEFIADDFAGIAQYNKNAGGGTTVDDICDILTNETNGDELHRLAAMSSLFYSESCLNYKYQNFVDSLSNVNITSRGNMRQWIYQTCTEYGWYQTSSQENQVFGDKFPIDYFTQLCEDVYGPEINANYTSDQIGRINTHFGGYDIDVRNVVFVHGSFDPWYPMGLTETTNPESPVIFIDGTAHCANMYSYFEGELPQLTEAREEISTLVGVWLGLETSGGNSHLAVSTLSMMLTALASLVIGKL